MAIFKTYRFNYIFIPCFVLFIFSFMFFFIPNTSAATQVTLEWSPNSEPDLAGYTVFAREDGQLYDYTNPSWEGTEATATIYNIDDTKTHYFVARAFDSEGFESGDSNEVCLTSGLVQEAENGILYGAFETASDSAASNGQYVQVLDGFGARGDGPDEAHKIEYTFTVLNAGLYQIKGWVYSDSAGSDSFWVKVNGSPTAGYLWDVFQNTSYQTDYVNDRYNADPVKVMLEAGINVITIYLREDGTRLDKIELEPLGDNQPPTAHAGPDQTVDEGQLIALNGSNSTDPDDGIASYHWVQTGGSVTLSDPNSQQATFTAPDVDEGGASLIFELTVVDQSGLESTDSCVVNVTWLNEPPQADAGTDKTVNEGGVVTLDGSSSLDIDDGIDVYSWTQNSGPTVTLSNPTSSQPTFTAPNVGPDGASLTFNLTVTDAGGLQDTDSCIVNISWQNEPPTAIVAEEYIEANTGATVTLDGSESTDADDGVASYLWTQVDGTPVTLSDPILAVTTFAVPETDQQGSNLTFQLMVTDAGGLQSTANCLVYITQTPIPDAGSDQTVDYGQIVTLNSNSTDPDGEIVSYQWTQISGTPVTLSDPTSAQPTFTAPDVGPDGDILTFSLTVTDNSGLQGTDICTIVVNPSSGGDQPGQVTLEWSPNSEPDLAGYRVFLREDGQSYDYTNPSWEGTGAMCTIYDLDDTKTYYFVARAFDSEGFESGDSNEVCLAQTSGSGGEKIIEAEDMPIKTTGGSTTDGWNIWSNGYIADDVNFQTEGTYTFDVTAKGSFAGGAWPIMEVRIDQTNVATVTVDSSNWTVYTIEAYVTSGMHEVAIAFTNDYYNSPEDRNLLIDKIIVTESGNNEPPIANAGQDQTTDAGQLVTLEAEDMPIKTTGGSTTDGWNIWSNGYIADDVNFQTEGTYTFDVTAKGSFAGGAWPIMEVRIDQTNVGTVTVDSSNWTVYTIEAYVTSGTHEVAIAFTNDYYNSPEDRNLLIDKIIVTDAGQLVTLNGSNSTDPDDGIASYHWVQTGGTPVTLSDPNSQQATFTAPGVETTGVSLTFELTVVDHGGLENMDTCVVNVIW